MKLFVIFTMLFFLSSEIYADIYLEKGLSYYKQKKFLMSIGQFRKALKNPKVAFQAHFYLGNCYLKNGNTQKATEHYTEALTLTSNKDFQSQILLNLGQAKHLEKDFESAISTYQQAYSLNPDLTQTFWLEGMAYYSMHQKNKVIQTWENYLTLSPSGKQSDNIRKALAILKQTNFIFPDLAKSENANQNPTNANGKKVLLNIEGVLDQIKPTDKGKVTDDEMEDIVK